MKDDPWRPVTVVTEENIQQVENLGLADRRIKLFQRAEGFKISMEPSGQILHEYLRMNKKFSALDTAYANNARKSATIGEMKRSFLELSVQIGVEAVDKKGKRPPRKLM